MYKFTEDVKDMVLKKMFGSLQTFGLRKKEVFEFHIDTYQK